MPKVAHARTLSAHARNELADYIRERAQLLGISDSKYVLGILEKWRTDGAPPISALDAAAQEISKKNAGVEAKKSAKSETAFKKWADDNAK